MEQSKLILEILVMSLALASTLWGAFSTYKASIKKEYAAEKDFERLSRGLAETNKKIALLERNQERSQKELKSQLDRVCNLLVMHFAEDGDTDSISGILEHKRNSNSR